MSVAMVPVTARRQAGDAPRPNTGFGPAGCEGRGGHGPSASNQIEIGNHSLRATGITDYLKKNGTLEYAPTMVNHSSPRTKNLYFRRSDEVSLDEYELMGI